MNPPLSFTPDGALRGARRIGPVALFTVPFGVAFGVAAIEAGLEFGEVLLMSVMVFSGAAQFAALDFWGEAIPLIPLLMAGFAVNGRHVLMGTSLYPWVKDVPRATLLGAFSVLSDPNYVDTMAAKSDGERDLGFLVGGGVALWLAWVLGTVVGLSAGDLFGDPQALGLDVVMASFFTAMLAGSWTRRTDTRPWIAAAIGTTLAYLYLPANWHIVVGSLAGGFAGAFRVS